METLRYGLVGGGFITQFHLRALESVRGVEVAGLMSRTPPHELAASVRQRQLGDAVVYDTVGEMAEHVDVIALYNPNFSRIDTMEQIAAAVADGAKLRGLICEKPLGRNMAEARRVVELATQIGAPTAYFENQIHMKMLQQARAQLAGAAAAMGPLALARSGVSTPARTTPGSGTRADRVGECCPTWAATASPSAGTCSPRTESRPGSSCPRPFRPMWAC